jgi:hypothetical protein
MAKALRRRAKNPTFTMTASPIKAYKMLEREIEKELKVLRKNVKHMNRSAILKAKSHLMLLLGECHYLAQECKRVIQKS